MEDGMAHGITAASTTLGSTGAAMTRGTMADGTIRGMEEVSLTHGITVTGAGTIRSTDICTLITADGTEDGTLTGTIITTIMSYILPLVIIREEKCTEDHVFRPKATEWPQATGSLQVPQAQRQEE